MADKKSALTTIVEIRKSQFDSISFKTLDFEGRTELLLRAEDGGGGTSFIFADPREFITFAERILDEAHRFI